MLLQRTIPTVIQSGDEGGYSAACHVLHAFTQGDTLDDVVANLRETIAIALEDEDLEGLGIAPDPVIIVSLELDPAFARPGRTSAFTD